MDVEKLIERIPHSIFGGVFQLFKEKTIFLDALPGQAGQAGSAGKCVHSKFVLVLFPFSPDVLWWCSLHGDRW